MGWLKSGYYTGDLPVRQVDDKTSAFKALAYAFKLKAEENLPPAPPGFVRSDKPNSERSPVRIEHVVATATERKKTSRAQHKLVLYSDLVLEKVDAGALGTL